MKKNILSALTVICFIAASAAPGNGPEAKCPADKIGKNNEHFIATSHRIDDRGTITGRIITSDGIAAPYVTVSLKGTKLSVITDENGYFTMRHVPAGEHTLEVSLVGYETSTHSVIVNENKNAIVSITLNVNDKQLEEVTVRARKTGYVSKVPSASLRLNEPLLQVPQNIQIVTSATLADQQVISMSDNLIRNVSGAARLEHWGDLYTNITMRGSQIQAFRNGFNVVSSYWGPLTEDMSFVDHIEFVKGPAGFMLGNGDPSGLYNVVTKKPTGQTKGEASLTVGSFSLYRTTLDMDGKLSKDGMLLYRLNLAGQNKGSFRANEFNDRYSFAPVISYQIDDKNRITAEYVLQHARMSDVGSFYVFSPDGYATLPRDFTTMPAGIAPTKINDNSVTVNFQHEFNSKWKLTAQAAYYNYKQQGSSMWPSTVNPDGTMVRGVGIWDARSTMNLGQVFINGSATTGNINHRILAGIDMGDKDYQADWAQSHNLDLDDAPFDPHNPTYGTPGNGYPAFDGTLNLEARAVIAGGLIGQQYTGIYIQDELGFFNNAVRLTLAARHTNVSMVDFGGPAITANHITPRVGLSWSIDKNTSVYGLYDQAFIPQSGRMTSGKHVQPLTGNNVEFGIKRDWANGRWNTTVSVYRILKNNELAADPNSAPNSGLSVELGQKRAQGIEFDLRGTLAEGLSLIANYAYTNAEVTKVTEGVQGYAVGDVVPGFCKHTVNTWLSYKAQRGALAGFGASAGFSWQIDRAMTNFSKTNTALNLPDYFRLDGGVFWENQQVRLTLNAFNVLDKYLYSGGYYDYLSAYYWQAEPPRNFRFSVAVKF